MTIETQCFTIEFQEADQEYIGQLIENLESNTARILSFFELSKLSAKKKIKIWNTKEDYQKHLEQYVDKYYDWMIADTFDGNINMLSLKECQKTTSHKNIPLTEYERSCCHEFVHACQQEINPNAKNVEWFWEALATNLGNPFSDTTTIDCKKEDLMHNFFTVPNQYQVCFTIGKFMLEHYSHDEILDYVRFPDKLIGDSDKIIDEATQWSNKAKNKSK